MIAKADLIGAARAALAGNPSRPLTAACLGAIGASLEAGEPTWWRETSQRWAQAQRHFPDAGQALMLLWAAVHMEALAGHPLAAQLPTCGGAPTEDLAQAVLDFLAAPPLRFYESIGRRRCRYGQLWGEQWLDPARLFFERRKLSYFVVDITSVGGLSACADLLQPRKAFDSELIEARVGLQSPALDLRKDNDAMWVVAGALPDDAASVRACAKAMRKLRGLLAEEPQTVQIAACPLEAAGSFIQKNIPVAPEGGLLVTSIAALAEQLDSARKPWLAAMQQALAPWADRALWVDLEPQPGEPNAYATAVYRAKAGKLEARWFRALTVYKNAVRLGSDDKANEAFLA